MMMRAIVRDAAGVALARPPVPSPGPGEVVLDVAVAGLCRSDLAAAAGEVAVPLGRVLGHELAGWVRAVGAGVDGVAVGAAVTVVPFAPCGDCAGCAGGGRCGALRWLGFARDGGFAEQICVPARSVIGLPPGMSLRHGAYVEPVAAALGSLAHVAPGMRVAVCGGGRIAELSARVLAVHGAVVTRGAAAGWFDVMVEHGGAEPALLAALRPGGTLILKSRAGRAVALDAGDVVARELVIRGAAHGSFTEAVAWLAERRIDVDDLLAPARPLEAYAEVFAAARGGEQQKQMFAIAERG
ncbi:MAG TPA: alcohol dehydrogenase catalytic domain-containing protein [Kofleriaceae bacterium]